MTCSSSRVPMRCWPGVESPGCFLNASAVLERRFTAFVMDRWMETGPPKGAVPEKLASALDAAENGGPPEAFPWKVFKFFDLNRTDMEEWFLAMFGDEITETTRERLRSFSRAEDGMRSRLLEGLNRRGRDLKNWRKNIRRINDEIKALDVQPMPPDERDKATAQLRQEKMALQSLVNSLKDRLLNFLTDEGLLPNYAFPEQAVTLQSIIWRERKDADGDECFKTEIYTYERPAAAAIAELAPANRFYAEGRRVEVAGIVFEPADLVDWRLCPGCSWMEQEGVNTPQNSCPKCSNSAWSDLGQRQTLLRMGQVIANTSDRDSRSFDESDDRTPKFYEKNMFVLKDDADIQDAYVLDDEEVPFGFEFLNRITLREVNFGEAGSGGRQLRSRDVNEPRARSNSASPAAR